jgi:hypothetical protein
VNSTSTIHISRDERLITRIVIIVPVLFREINPQVRTEPHTTTPSMSMTGGNRSYENGTSTIQMYYL